MAPGYTVRQMPARGRVIPIWGMFSLHALGLLISVHHFLTTVRYSSPIDVNIVSAGDGHYQQDNAECYTARMREWFEEHDGDFQIMPWSPNMPDLNSVEHL